MLGGPPTAHEVLSGLGNQVQSENSYNSPKLLNTPYKHFIMEIHFQMDSPIWMVS